MEWIHPILSAQSKHSRAGKQSPSDPDMQEISHVMENFWLLSYLSLVLVI